MTAIPPNCSRFEKSFLWFGLPPIHTNEKSVTPHKNHVEWLRIIIIIQLFSACHSIKKKVCSFFAAVYDSIVTVNTRCVFCILGIICKRSSPHCHYILFIKTTLVFLSATCSPFFFSLPCLAYLLAMQYIFRLPFFSSSF